MKIFGIMKVIIRFSRTTITKSRPHGSLAANFFLLAIVVVNLSATTSLAAQKNEPALEAFSPQSLSTQDYDRATRLFLAGERSLVRNTDVIPNWIGESDRFWYRKETADGAVFALVDASDRTVRPAFDHAALSKTLARATGQEIAPHALPFRHFDYEDGGNAIAFEALGYSWTCSLRDKTCVKTEQSKFAPNRLASPDGLKAVFRKNRNLWLEEDSGQERALTSSGVKFNEYAYLSGNSQIYVSVESMADRIPPFVAWSPDSKMFVTHRIDETKVGKMSLWQGAPSDGSLRSKVTFFRQSQIADVHHPVTSYVIFNTDQDSRIAVTGLPDGMIFDPIGGLGQGGPWWTEDSSAFYIQARDVHHRRVGLYRVDAENGVASLVVEERSPTFVSMSGATDSAIRVTLKIFDQGRQLLWFSERDGWGHLYRYDLETGKLINQVTSGSWVVTGIVDIDQEDNVLYFTGTGREAGRNPYYSNFYRVNLDGSGLTLLTPENADHLVHAPGNAAWGIPPVSKLSPSFRYFVDSYSTVDTVPLSVLRSTATGAVLKTIEEADLSALGSESQWTRPQPFSVKARDSETDLFGTMYLPSNLDPTKKYPVIDNVYFAPHFVTPDVRSFSRNSLYRQALAELGFIVISMHGLGTPGRGKAFHDFSYGNFQDGPGLPDHVGGVRQLARLHPQIDIDRVGVLGHSSGGYSVVLAMLKYPEFYKVGVASAAAVDMRGGIPYALEKWQGPPQQDGENYAPVALKSMASNLSGKLLLAYGDMDEHAPTAPILQFIDALHKENRDYDLIVMQNQDHHFSRDPYFIRRTFDYFVRNLMGSEPPRNYLISAP